MFYPTISSFFEAEGDFQENEPSDEEIAALEDDDDLISDILDLLEGDPWEDGIIRVPHPDKHYTASDRFSDMPEGYRWATEEETERWNHPAYYNKMVQVVVGWDHGDPLTDLAIKD